MILLKQVDTDLFTLLRVPTVNLTYGSAPGVYAVQGPYTGPPGFTDYFSRYCGLGRTVTALGLDSRDDIELDYVCSSIGAVKLDLLAALYYAAQGDSGTKEIEARTARAKRSKDATVSAVDQIDLAKIRVYFPSRDTVLRSRGGSNVSLV